MKTVRSVVPAPIAGSPQEADRRRLRPRTGNPIISRITPTPISRNPKIIWFGAGGLFIDRHGRRRLGYRNRLFVVAALVVALRDFDGAAAIIVADLIT